MQTITQINPSQHSVKWADKTIGMIQTSPGQQWSYCRYSKYPETFTGTYAECIAKAEQDYSAVQPKKHKYYQGRVRLLSIDWKTVDYWYRNLHTQGYRGNWRLHGAGKCVSATVSDTKGEFQIYIPVETARSLRAGQTCEYRRDSLDGHSALVPITKPILKAA